MDGDSFTPATFGESTALLWLSVPPTAIARALQPFHFPVALVCASSASRALALLLLSYFCCFSLSSGEQPHPTSCAPPRDPSIASRLFIASSSLLLLLLLFSLSSLPSLFPLSSVFSCNCCTDSVVKSRELTYRLVATSLKQVCSGYSPNCLLSL